MNDELKIKDVVLPVMSLRGLVLFPDMMLHFDIGRKKSILALNEAMGDNQTVFFVTQRDLKVDEPKKEQLYSVGVVAKVKQVLRQPGNVVRVLVEGKYRAKIKKMLYEEPFLMAEIEPCQQEPMVSSLKSDALVRKTKELFEDYLKVASQLPPDLIVGVRACNDAGELADYIASNIVLEYKDKQVVLSEINPIKRLDKLMILLSNELGILSLEEDISIRLKDRIDKSQREYYLREQIKVISEELGEGDNPQAEAEELRNKIKSLKLDDEVTVPLLKECDRLFKMPYGSHEANVIRSYIDTCLELPWNKKSKENINLDKARKVLDRDHYGLKKVKDRILETLAVRKLAPDIKGQIICLVGPPGVGKTSIAKSIAKSIGRKFVRVALGGVKDESDIRGHRRTYVGAMPGRIIASIKTAGTKNPLMLLDEIDKLSNDFHGDPTAALLEVLDAEQNNTFFDHYIDLPFDLSDVFFITTANDYNAIPSPLMDRMEVIDLSSYTHEEKFNIAKKHLLPKLLKKHGLNSKIFKITDKALHEVISGYTREAGVRTLERTIASLIRKSAENIVSGEKKRVVIDQCDLEPMLGPKKYKDSIVNNKSEIGVTNGLAWTSVGGETMPIEVAIMPGTGKIELTGSLGDVMKESAHIAISYIRSNCDKLMIKSDFYKVYDIHIHAPEGAIPKDGPSAGVTMATSMVSSLLNKPVKSDVAMTGEITLRGKVLPIGGLKEKTMAAYRAGIKTVIIPEDNSPDLVDIDPVVKNSLKFVLADKLDTVFKNALEQDEDVDNDKETVVPQISNELTTDNIYVSQ